MAQNKNYNNFVEIVGNVAKVYQKPENENGEMRFILANNRNYTKKDGTSGRKTDFINVLVRPGRKWAKQGDVTVGAFMRIKGHLENNSYQAEDGTWKGGVEINADSLKLLLKKDDGTVEDPETGEVVEEEVTVTEE